MAEKLTPRVGDRVLVVRGFDYRVPYTKCGWVRGFDEHGGPLVDIDGVPDRIMVPLPHCQVVDREPVEWPGRWSKSRVYAGCVVNGMHVYERYELEQILATGPDMLTRWDELMGES